MGLCCLRIKDVVVIETNDWGTQMVKFKEKWGIESNIQLSVILLVFAITGSSSVRLANMLVSALGFGTEDTYWLTHWVMYVLSTVMVYQVLLIVVGALFGQFPFFWKFEQKMLSRMGLSFLFKKADD